MITRIVQIDLGDSVKELPLARCRKELLGTIRCLSQTGKWEICSISKCRNEGGYHKAKRNRRRIDDMLAEAFAVCFYFPHHPHELHGLVDEQFLLFGGKGHMRTLAPGRSQVNMIETRKREHSRKPDEQYALIESCSPGPYLELFARYPQPHWHVWGNEAAEDIVPKGKVYKGYEGGAIMPKIEPNERIPEDVAEKIGQALREEYENGSSINELAAKYDYSIHRTRKLLTMAGATFRKRGPNTTAEES